VATIDLTKRGPAGIDGTAIASGHGNPRASFGLEGWLYVNLSSTALFRKENGEWKAQFFMKGLKGEAGKRGVSLRAGEGAPPEDIGNPGDNYVDLSTSDVYGPKASSGSWPITPIGSLAGPQGDQGEIGLGWYSGSGAPNDADGRDGEVYFRTSNDDVYAKAGGAWSVVANLKGGVGDTGDTGPSPLLPVTPWVSGMTAVVGPPATFVSNAGSSYECLVAHTAGADFATDLAAGKWGLVAEKGLDGSGTGTVNPTGAGALAGKLAVFADNGGTSIGGTGGKAGGAIDWAAAVDIASAGTCDIGAATSNIVRITGSTTITALGSIAAGAVRWVLFAGSLTLTHNATSLILPGAANITTAAGDTAVFVSEGSGNWRCLGYQRANGGIIAQAAASDFWAGTSVSKPTTPKTIADAGALVSLTSGTTINTDGSAGQNFMVTLDHNATFAAPTNLIDGKVYTWIIKQGSTGGTGAFNAAFEFPSAPTLSTGAGKYDIVSAVYCAADSKLIARFSKGS